MNLSYWLPVLVFLVHVAEELPGFPAWATRHFARTSRAWYVYSHLVLLAAAATIAARAQLAEPRTIWPTLAVAFQWTLGVNALFHIATSIWFREYSPGLLTASFVSIPATAYLSQTAIAADALTTTQFMSAAGLGTVASALAVASLWLPTDMDWSFRRRSPDGHQ